MSKDLMLLPTENEWAQMKELATVAIKSKLLPNAIQTAEQAIIIMMKGRELGLPPMVAFSHINVIQGKPTMSAEIMLAYIYKDHPGAEIEFVTTTDEKCEIHAKRANGKKLTPIVWDMARAKKMGLDQKDNWKKQPGTMLKWRCITEMKRTLFSEVLMGVDYTPEELGASLNDRGEVVDVTPRGAAAEQPTAEPKSINAIKNHATGEAIPLESNVVSEAAKPSPVPTQEPLKMARPQMAIEIATLQTRLKYSRDQLTAYCKELFNVEPTKLTNPQMDEFILWLRMKEKENAK